MNDVGIHRFTGSIRIFVDKINSALYVVDQSRYFIVKYTNGSLNGETIFDSGSDHLSSNLSKYAVPVSGVVDDMENIIIGEINRITKWTSDLNSSFIVTSVLNTSSPVLYSPTIMILDRFENLYIYESISGQVIKYIKNSTSCINV